MDDGGSTASETTQIDDGGDALSAVSDSSSFYGEYEGFMALQH